jgi:malonyl-CoA O-methyltransferase
MTDLGPYTLDPRAVRRSFARAAQHYDEAAFLQRKVADAVLERLDLFRLDPRRILDLGAGTGYGARHLAKRYPKARCLALDLSPEMLRIARRRAPWLCRRHDYVAGDAVALPLASASVDLIYSSLALQWVGDLDACFSECRRVLRPGGLLLFATFGPDTLKELRAAFAAAGPGIHVHAFLDMHDVGDALVRAGLGHPVLDVDRLTVQYPRVMDLLRALQGIGAHNAASGRGRGLTGKGRIAAMRAHYEGLREGGRLPATYEVVHGHAFAPLAPSPLPPGGPAPPGETRIPVAAIRRHGPG